MNWDKRREIYLRLQAENPAPTTELKYGSPFQLLVSVILSAQATDVSVNRATKSSSRSRYLGRRMLDLGLPGLKEHIKSIGLFNTKAANILKTCEAIISLTCEVPRERAALEAFPGVGRKTANVVLNTAFGKPTIAVDTHIFRVANRTKLALGKTPRQVEDKLLRFTPNDLKRDAHHWLILHGRYVCIARKPRCGACVIEDLCEYRDKTDP